MDKSFKPGEEILNVMLDLAILYGQTEGILMGINCASLVLYVCLYFVVKAT